MHQTDSTSGIEVCQCKGKVMSVHDTKTFTDMQGNKLFTIKNKMLSIHKSFHCDSPHGYDFEVKGHFKLVGSHSSVTFKNAADQEKVELEVNGDWIDRSANIEYGGRPVAHISRSFINVREIFGDKQTVSFARV